MMLSSNKKSSSWVYALIVVSLVITYFYYLPQSSSVPATRIRPTTWMHSFFPLLIVGVLTLIISVFYWVRKYNLVTTAGNQLYIFILNGLIYLLFNPWGFETLAQLPLSVVLSASFFFLSYALIGKLTYAVWPFVFFLSLVSYATKLKGIQLNSDILRQIFCTSWQDAQAYITWYNIILISFAFIASFYMWYMVQKRIGTIQRRILFSNGLLLLTPALTVMLMLKSNLDVDEKYAWPLGNTQQLVRNSKNAVVSIQKIKKLTELLPSDEISADFATDVQYDGVTCILHVGESVSANHLHINGYNRNTTPWLSQQKHLVNFKDCISSAIVTDCAVITIVTNARRDYMTESNPLYHPSSPSLVDFFKASGFKCATYWDNCYIKNNTNDVFAKQVKYFNRKADAVYGSPESNYMEQLPQVFAFTDKYHKENKFLLINNFGSHAFFEGYDHNNPPFPVLFKPRVDFRPKENVEHAEAFINAYDSTIHLTDKYIATIANHLKGQPFIYIFVSDHGEYLGDNGYWQRSQVPFAQYHQHEPCKVPFFIYASPEFEQKHPHFKKAMEQLRKNQHLSTAHEHVFHTVLGIMGIETPYYDITLDLTKSGVVPYSGPHPSRKGKSAQKP